jgi:hypothetical protein
MPHAVFFLPSVLWHSRQTIAHLVLRPKPRNRRDDFVGQINKPQLPVLRPKTGNPSEWFWSQTIRTVVTDFEVKSGEIVELGFEPKPRNLRSSSPYARCRSHTASLDLSIIWLPSTRSVLDHSRSSAPSLLLLPRFSLLLAMLHLSPTHHETSKHVSPHETYSRVEPPKFAGFKFKLRQVNYSSQIKPRYWPLGFSERVCGYRRRPVHSTRWHRLGTVRPVQHSLNVAKLIGEARSAGSALTPSKSTHCKAQMSAGPQRCACSMTAAMWLHSCGGHANPSACINAHAWSRSGGRRLPRH